MQGGLLAALFFVGFAWPGLWVLALGLLVLAVGRLRGDFECQDREWRGRLAAL